MRGAGRAAEADVFEKKVQAAKLAKDRELGLYEKANAVPTLGIAPHAELYHRLADLREAMGRGDEAAAWHRLVLGDQPGDRISTAALARLEKSTETVEPANK